MKNFFVHKSFPRRQPISTVSEQSKAMSEESIAMEQDNKQSSSVNESKSTDDAKNNRKSTKKMTTMEKVAAAEAAAENLEPKVKVLKKDKGLIERTESSKIILTEDNREVLTD